MATGERGATDVVKAVGAVIALRAGSVALLYIAGGTAMTLRLFLYGPEFAREFLRRRVRTTARASVLSSDVLTVTSLTTVRGLHQGLHAKHFRGTPVTSEPLGQAKTA
jgi:hypothetical protein